MKTACMMAGILALGTGAFAQAPAATAAPDANKVVITRRADTIATAVAALAKAANATVVVDPALTGDVPIGAEKMLLEQGLGAIAKSTHGQWRRVYLKDAEIPRKADGTIDATRLRQIVEAASAAPSVTVGVFDPATGTISMTTRVAATAPSTVEWLKPRKAVYLLYRPAIVGSALGQNGDPVADYLATQKNSMESFRNMSPEQRSEAMKQGIEMTLNMDPDIMGSMMKQSMEAMQNLSPETKAKLMDMSIKMMSGAQNGTPQ